MKKTSKKPPRTKSKTISNSDSLSSLRIKLKTADPEIQHYVFALEEENLKLHKKIGNLQADNVSLNNRITILKENTNDRCPHENLPIKCIEQNIINLEKQEKELELKLRKPKRKR